MGPPPPKLSTRFLSGEFQRTQDALGRCMVQQSSWAEQIFQMSRSLSLFLPGSCGSMGCREKARRQSSPSARAARRRFHASAKTGRARRRARLSREGSTQHFPSAAQGRLQTPRQVPAGCDFLARAPKQQPANPSEGASSSPNSAFSLGLSESDHAFCSRDRALPSLSWLVSAPSARGRPATSKLHNETCSACAACDCSSSASAWRHLAARGTARVQKAKKCAWNSHAVESASRGFRGRRFLGASQLSGASERRAEGAFWSRRLRASSPLAPSTPSGRRFSFERRHTPTLRCERRGEPKSWFSLDFPATTTITSPCADAPQVLCP